MTMNKVRWGELDEDDIEFDNNYLLPPKQVTGPNANGVKTITDYKFDDKGHKVKTTTKTRAVVKAYVSKGAVERRSWAKFGDAVNDDGVGGGFTTVSFEEIRLDRPGSDKENDRKASNTDTTGSGTLKICRNCNKKGEHWTVECPYENLLNSSHASIDEKPSVEAATTSKKYVPPRPTATDQRRGRDEANTVRVNNLSEDTKEADLQDLFEPFGRVSRAFVAVDRNTKMSRGFGFVTLARKEDAQKAIDKLNGYGYDNLILSVEWSVPQSKTALQ